jgi:hypothetical protein
LFISALKKNAAISIKKNADCRRINNLMAAFKSKNSNANSFKNSITQANGSTSSNQSKSSSISLRNVRRDNKAKRIFRNYRIELNITKNSLCIIVVFCGAWLPYSIISLLGQYSDNREYYVTPLTTLITVIIAKSSAVFNPILYIYSGEYFRKKFSSKFLNFFKTIV